RARRRRAEDAAPHRRRQLVDRDPVKVLITGAGGMLGRASTDALSTRGHEVVALPREELDVLDAAEVTIAVERELPDVVLNCAAWTDVDGAEAHEEAATLVNDRAAAVLAAAADTAGASFVYPSSDYVFDGRKPGPYVERDMPAPLSAYGRSKLAGETSVAVANSRHLIVRSSWLFGVGGANFVETMLRIGAEEQEVIVVNDQIGLPTYTRHLAGGIASLIDAQATGIYHVAASSPCSWFDFAQEIFDQAGLECQVMAGTTEMLARPAPRPAYSVLGTAHGDTPVLPSWQEGLAAYLVERESGAGLEAGEAA
ncbi:MAG: dTDP-4-dehydrorhamnose reductase, partial [Solirubrobacterales bacterium]